jgi:pantoate--beta-alanine ligase
MRLITEPAGMKEFSLDARRRGDSVVLVPTMGCLHRGHRELLKRGKTFGGRLVLSIFVNPAQFGAGEDFNDYPRNLERDLDVAEEEGVDAVFTPAPADIYPDGYGTYVEVGELGEKLCGRKRPGHFRGVATVVLKLLNIAQPDWAVFGMKDYQQLVIIRKMVSDLELGTNIIGVETVREPDGLAMSSRNAYLGAKEREAATVIPRALDAASSVFEAGVRESSEIIEKMQKIIETEPLAVVEYIEVCDPEGLSGLDRIDDAALVAVAARVGPARLIDNRILRRGA